MIASTYVSPSTIRTRVLAQTFCSSCGSFSESEDSLLVLPVHLSDSVQDAVDHYTADESLPEYICLICKKTGAHLEKNFIALPDVLVVQLKRFQFVNGKSRKLDKPVSCDLALTIRTQSSSSPVSHNYKLMSVVHHTGNLSTGHYTTTVINDGGKMYLCNDQAVDPCRRVDFKSAYILFYVRT